MPLGEIALKSIGNKHREGELNHCCWRSGPIEYSPLKNPVLHLLHYSTLSISSLINATPPSTLLPPCTHCEYAHTCSHTCTRSRHLIKCTYTRGAYQKLVFRVSKQREKCLSFQVNPILITYISFTNVCHASG